MKALFIFLLFLSFSILHEEKKIVFVVGKKSHDCFSHEHIAGCKLLANHLDSANIGIHSDVRKCVLTRGENQHVAWAFQRGSDHSFGRGFGFTGRHNHVNWGAIHYRKLVLNAIAWIAKVDIPQGGLNPGNVSVADLQENQEYPYKEFECSRYLASPFSI